KVFAKADTSDEATIPECVAASGNVGAPFTGYHQKGIFYYKSRHKGKAVNINAKHLNNLFTEELRQFEFDKKYSKNLQDEIKRIITDKLQDQLQEQVQMKKQLTELNGKIEKLEQRFIESEINKELFEK